LPSCIATVPSVALAGRVATAAFIKMLRTFVARLAGEARNVDARRMVAPL